MSLSQKERITGVKKSIVKINELYVKKFGKSIRPSISKKIINFITRLTIDLTSIEIVKSIASKAGFTIKEDEKKKLAAYIDSIKSNRSELLVSIGNIYQSMVFSKTAQGLLDYGGVNDIIKDAKNKKYFKKDEDVLEELVTNQSLKSVVKDLVPKELQSEFESLLKQIEKEKKEKK